MNTFEVKLSYAAIADNGKVIKVNNSYIIEAYSYTEAEVAINKIINDGGIVSATIKSMKPSNINEILCDKEPSDDTIYYKVKIEIKQDEGKGIKSIILINGTDISDSLKKFKDAMRGTVSDWTVISVVETDIVSVVKM